MQTRQLKNFLLGQSIQACFYLKLKQKFQSKSIQNSFLFRNLSLHFAWLGEDLDYSIHAWDPIFLEYQSKFGIRPLALSSSSRLSARLYSVCLIVFVYLCWINTEASSLDDKTSNLFIQVKVRSWAEPYIWWWTCHFRTLTSDEFPNSVFQKSFRTLPFQRVFELCNWNSDCSRKVLQKKLSKGLFPGNPLLSE
jgi:hypothetical protein